MKEQTQPLFTNRSACLGSLGLVLLWGVLCQPGVNADFSAPDELRAVTSVAGSDDVTQVSAVYRLQPSWRLHSRYLEFAAGTLTGGSDTRPMLSIGPVWQFPTVSERFNFRFGIAPTLIAGSNFGDKDLGGNFHFTSFVAIALTFGEKGAGSFALRLQHTSNAGLESTNPGLDMAGISFGYRFAY